MSALAIERLNAALTGRYRIERQIGEGGMATVYLAEDLRHEREVALKVLKPELAALVGAERFLAEIKTTANLKHPHILPLFDSGEADGFLFYVMPYVDGDSLRDRLDRVRQLSVDDAVRIATDVAEALEHAHRQGVVHRDIKPANILLQDGRPVVSDFGIALAVSAGSGARLTETGLSVGTPHYMSPEQATGEQYVGPTSDVYALACVLYEMLVGEPPFTGRTPQAVLSKILVGEPSRAAAQRKSVPPHVDAVIAMALEKVPADRFDSAHAFAAALGAPHFRHEPAPTSGPSPRERNPIPRPRAPRVPAWAASFAAGVLMGVGGVTALVVRPGSERPLCTWHDPAESASGARQVSCDLQEVDIHDLLGEFADSLGRSIVPGPDVGGTITARVTRQAWDEALALLFRNYDLMASEDANGNLSVVTIQSINDRESIEPLITRAFQVRYRSADDIADIVVNIVTSRGSVATDTLSNTLTLNDIQRVVDATEALLAELDRPVEGDSVG